MTMNVQAIKILALCFLCGKSGSFRPYGGSVLMMGVSLLLLLLLLVRITLVSPTASARISALGRRGRRTLTVALTLLVVPVKGI